MLLVVVEISDEDTEERVVESETSLRLLLFEGVEAEAAGDPRDAVRVVPNSINVSPLTTVIFTVMGEGPLESVIGDPGARVIPSTTKSL